MKVHLFKSPRKEKKYRAIFYDDDGNEIKFSDFGAKGMSDYTKHKNIIRKDRYIDRHRKREEKFWKTDPTAPATLSRYILWNKKTLRSSFIDFKKRFNLK